MMVKMHPAPRSDGELLADWLHHQRERAFHELAGRYSGLVHAAAKRTCGEEAMAAEAAQLTFILLAGKAGALSSRASLAGWLHLTAVMQAKNLMRRRRREARRNRLFQIDMETGNDGEPARVWREIQPVLDEALAALPEKDREVLLLHYHRALPFHEIARLLGIATDAARKRVTRATEKLRGKLARRGVPVAGALSVALLAGFTADAQAGLPASIVAGKALSAAGTASSGTAITAASLMKASTFIPPVAALLAAGLWILPKREAIASLERRYATLAAPETGGRPTARQSPGDRGRMPVTTGSKTGDGGIDWESIFRLQGDDDGSGRVTNFRDIRELMLDHRLKAMSLEGLLAELNRIAELEVPDPMKVKAEARIHHILSEKDPLFALTHLQGLLGGKPDIAFPLGNALKQYMKSDPAGAVAWLDRQIAEGRLDVKSLTGRNTDRERLEGVLIAGLMASDPDAAAERLSLLRPEDRPLVLAQFARGIKVEDQAAYARMVRAAFPEGEQPALIAKGAWVPFGNYQKVDDYLERISATPPEQLAACQEAAASTISTITRNRKLTAAELEKTWRWLEDRAPGSNARLFGGALGPILTSSYHQDMADVADLVLRYGDRPGGEEVLRVFFSGREALRKKEQSRQVAAFIQDGSSARKSWNC